MANKFRIGQRVKVKGVPGVVVKLIGRDPVLPELWFKCSDGFTRRYTSLRRIK
jgi:hypothetical protein